MHRAAVLLLLPSGVLGDVFVLRDGREIDGFPAGLNAKKELVLGTEKGPVAVAKDRVKEVRPSEDAAADFERYLAGLGPKDADGAAALGAWGKERGLDEPSYEAFRRALAIQPDHPVAREGLGWIKVDGRWLSPEEADAYRREEEARAEIRKKYEEMMGERPEVRLSPHWRCVDFLRDEKAAARVADLEKAWDEAVRVFDGEPWEGRALVVACGSIEKYLLWVEKDARSIPGFGPKFVEYAKKSTGIKWTEPPVLGRSDMPSRAAMHAANVHASGHLLLNNWGVHNREQPFWIEEGYGGWTESTVLKTNSSYCWAVAAKGYGANVRDTKQWDVEEPDWKALCKQAAARGEFLSLDELDRLPAAQYSRREVGQAFSLVRFLLQQKGIETFRSYVAEVKRGTKSADAFRQAYRKGLAEMEPEWKAWLQGGGW